MTAKPHHEKLDEAQDRTMEDSFPASDPPANTGIVGPDSTDKPSDPPDTAAIPTGTPTSDRHAAETAHRSEPEENSLVRLPTLLCRSSDVACGTSVAHGPIGPLRAGSGAAAPGGASRCLGS